MRKREWENIIRFCFPVTWNNSIRVSTLVLSIFLVAYHTTVCKLHTPVRILWWMWGVSQPIHRLIRQNTNTLFWMAVVQDIESEVRSCITFEWENGFLSISSFESPHYTLSLSEIPVVIILYLLDKVSTLSCSQIPNKLMRCVN